MICYDDYPLRIVVVNLVELLAALVLGAILMAQFGWWAVLFYGAMGCLGLILSLAYGCTRCRYYGRASGWASERSPPTSSASATRVNSAGRPPRL